MSRYSFDFVLVMIAESKPNYLFNYDKFINIYVLVWFTLKYLEFRTLTRIIAKAKGLQKNLSFMQH